MSHSFDPGPHNIAQTFVHLKDGGAGEPIPVGKDFWDMLAKGRYPQLETGRLLSQHVFAEDWPVWERHPAGDELVMLLSGSADFVLETASGEQIAELRRSGDYVLVPAGTWHTARTRVPATALFITPGHGTQHRAVKG